MPSHGYTPVANLFFPGHNTIIFQVSVAPPDGVLGFPKHDDPRPAYQAPTA